VEPFGSTENSTKTKSVSEKRFRKRYWLLTGRAGPLGTEQLWQKLSILMPAPDPAWKIRERPVTTTARLRFFARSNTARFSEHEHSFAASIDSAADPGGRSIFAKK